MTVLGAVTGLVVMSAGTAFAYFTATDSSHPAAALAATLTAPTGGAQNGTATATSIPIKWSAPSGYTPTSYTVLRCTGSSCTPTAAVANGTCSGSITATSCTDTDSTLVAGTTYTYAVEANFHSWVSPASASFQASTAAGASKLTFTTQPALNANINAAGTSSPDTFAVAVAIQTSGGVTITSDNTDTVTLGIATGHNPGSGTLTCSGGTTATAVSGVATFTGCAINKAGTGYQLTASSSTSPSLTAPANANSFNIVAGPAKQLAFTTAPVSGVKSSTANLGPITVQLQDADGNPVTAGASGVSVSLSANAGVSEFSSTQNGTSTTSITIPSGSSSVSFWFGDRNAENPVTITAASTGLTSATQPEVVTNPSFSATDEGNGTAACSGGTCTGPTVSTTNGNTELIFVYVAGSGHTSASTNTLGGPFTGASLYADQQMTQTEQGGSTDNFLYAYTATGSGGSGAVTFTPSAQATGATVWIDVVELGAGDSTAGCGLGTCTDGGTGSPALATLFLPGSDSEVAFLGTPDSTSFTAPSGFSLLGGGGTNQYGTWSDPTAQSSASFTMGAHGKGWGSIAVQVSP